MDESLKVIIATISGFVIAFFAEPVKLFFQQRTRKKNLRRALYYELYTNYDSLEYFYDKRKDKELTNRDMYQFVEGVKHIARLEAFQHYISHEIDSFYQLREATTINSLYSNLSLLLEYAPLRAQKKAPFDLTMQQIKHFLAFHRYYSNRKTG